MSEKTLRVFHNATAIVTGAASGIGRAIAEELARRGCEVVLADLQVQLAEEVAAAIQAAGGKARACKLDVADVSAVKRLLRDTVRRSGRVDYLFNNAGIAVGAPVELHKIADWNRIIDVNLQGVVNGVHIAYPIMLRQGFGHIVNTASAAGLMPSMAVSYTTTKYAVVGLSMSLRAEAASAGIRVSVLCPGVIRTPILEGGGKYGKMLVKMSPEQQRDMWEEFKPMPPAIFARKALDAIAKNKAIIIIPAWWKLFWWINRLSPSLGMLLVQKQYQKMKKKYLS